MTFNHTICTAYPQARATIVSEIVVPVHPQWRVDYIEYCCSEAIIVIKFAAMVELNSIVILNAKLKYKIKKTCLIHLPVFHDVWIEGVS